MHSLPFEFVPKKKDGPLTPIQKSEDLARFACNDETNRELSEEIVMKARFLRRVNYLAIVLVLLVIALYNRFLIGQSQTKTDIRFLENRVHEDAKRGSPSELLWPDKSLSTSLRSEARAAKAVGTGGGKKNKRRGAVDGNACVPEDFVWGQAVLNQWKQARSALSIDTLEDSCDSHRELAAYLDGNGAWVGRVGSFGGVYRTFRGYCKAAFKGVQINYVRVYKASYFYSSQLNFTANSQRTGCFF